MNTYLNMLNEREKWMVLGTLVCLILYCYYSFLYTPLTNQVQQKSKQLIEKKNTLVWMQQIKQQHHLSKKQTIDNNQLLTVLATQLKDNPNLSFTYQIQQTGSGDIQITFDEVAFNLFMAWLEKINEKYTVVVKQFNAERRPTPGIARVMILVSGSA